MTVVANQEIIREGVTIEQGEKVWLTPEGEVTDEVGQSFFIKASEAKILFNKY